MNVIFFILKIKILHATAVCFCRKYTEYSFIYKQCALPCYYISIPSLLLPMITANDEMLHIISLCSS